jgi:hypothetical protein
MVEIAQKLDQLASLYSSSDKLKSEKQELINGLISPEILLKIQEIETEYTEKEKGITDKIDILEVEIKADTLKFGKTVKASRFISMWSKGRVTWDNKGLSTYSTTHPEILVKRKNAGEFRTNNVQNIVNLYLPLLILYR